MDTVLPQLRDHLPERRYRKPIDVCPWGDAIEREPRKYTWVRALRRIEASRQREAPTGGSEGGGK